MRECEACGARATKKAKIEGVVMNVCEKCVELGIEIVKPVMRAPMPRTSPKELDIIVRRDFSRIVKREREKKGLTQEQLGKKLMLRASVITRIEGGWEPSLSVVEKLEKFFRIRLKEEVASSEIKENAQRKELTIGDIVEIKKKK